MSVVKTLNKNATVKQQTSADLPSNPVKYITQRGSQTSTDGQTVINLGFAVDLSIKDAFLLIVDGKVLLEGSGNDYTFTSVQSNNTSAQVTLTQSLTVGLNICYILLGALVQTEPSVNTLAATVASLSSGSGTGGINYITAYDAEKTVAGWNRFQDAAAATPTDGTGTLTANNITLTQNTTTPLRGTADFKITKDAVNRQGEGVSYDFTIDRADQAKPLTITFDYSGSGVTWATSTTSIGDIQVWIYDKDAAQLIQPAAYTLDGSKKFKGVFQTSASSLNYRLILFVGGTTATSWTFNFDNVKVGPDYALLGCPVTDWKNDLAWTFGSGYAVSSYGIWYRRVGDSLHVRGWFQSGTVSAGSLGYIQLPAGYTLDTSKFPSGSNVHRVGLASQLTAATNALGSSSLYQVIFYDGSTNNQLFFGWQASSAQYQKTNANSLINSNENCAFEFSVPITGWGSTTQMSNDTDTRLVSFYAQNNSNQSLATGVNLQFPNNIQDSHGAWNGTDTYTVPVPGDYYVTGSFNISTPSAGDVYVYKNGVMFMHLTSWVSNSNCYNGGALLRGLKAGDTLKLQHSVSSATFVANSGLYFWLSIFRLSGPSAIAATEAVNAKYYCTGVGTANATTPINFDAKVYDSHGFVTTGSGWKATAPVAGKYSIKVLVNPNVAPGGSVYMDIYVNGVLYEHFGYVPASSGNPLNCSTTIPLLAGDTVQIRTGNSSLTYFGTASLASFPTKIEIEKVGN
jgi:hypothetical protein